MFICSVKSLRIKKTMFIAMILICFSFACSEKKRPALKTKHREMTAVCPQKNTAEIYIHPCSTPGFEEEDVFAIKSKADHRPFERQIKNPIKVNFSSQTIIDSLEN